jgi:phosphoenolpyruvate carboxykinase (GTP)
VNWFRTDENGKFLWPGYGENSRVLKWIFERCDGKVNAVDTPIGRLPAPADFDTTGLDLPPANIAKLLSVDLAGWHAEIPSIMEHFARFGSRLPDGLSQEVRELEDRLRKAGN